MERTHEDLTLKCENDKNEIDIEGTVIKVELKSQLIEFQKPNERHQNANQGQYFVEIKHEIQTHHLRSESIKSTQ